MNSPTPSGVREIAHGDPLYHEASRARDRILRQPLGLRLSDDDTRGESVQRHFVLEIDGRLIGGVIAKAHAPKVVRLRQMWIEPDHAGNGHGRRLLDDVLATLEREGIERVVLHARESALGFYRKGGFKEEGEPFTEVGISHRRMTCALSPETRSPDCRR